ncbi:MAG: hypothetical protein JRF21_09920 [Deltaproteobacteria bacterium]|nr:hypothetical protein [Deltaproteobacteria bacterium]
MMNKKLLSVFLLIFCFSATAHAGSHKDLYTELVDIEGWTAGKPTGTSVSGMMLNVSRDYKKGDSRLTVMITVNKMAPLTRKSGLRKQILKDSGIEVKNETIEGFDVHKRYEGTKKSSEITVYLNDNSKMTLNYKKLPKNQALELAKKFNWANIKKKLDTF